MKAVNNKEENTVLTQDATHTEHTVNSVLPVALHQHPHEGIQGTWYTKLERNQIDENTEIPYVGIPSY